MNSPASVFRVNIMLEYGSIASPADPMMGRRRRHEGDEERELRARAQPPSCAGRPSPPA
jgi:hypothetical protein